MFQTIGATVISCYWCCGCIIMWIYMGIYLTWALPSASLGSLLLRMMILPAAWPVVVIWDWVQCAEFYSADWRVSLADWITIALAFAFSLALNASALCILLEKIQ